jgi:hypothetical protein
MPAPASSLPGGFRTSSVRDFLAGGGDTITIDAESTGSNEKSSDITCLKKRKESLDGIFPDNRSFTTSNNK